MIVATRPLIDCCPVVPAAMEGRYIAQWDKDSCADAGFLKIDLLGLGMLSAVERCVELIARTRGRAHRPQPHPARGSRATYEAIQNAETTGVFQIESRAQMQSLLRTRPENLKDIAIQVAIVRPGPIQGGAVNPYIERRQRLRVDPDYQIPYEHPSLEPALRETLGAIIFQDQVLEVASGVRGVPAGGGRGPAAGDEPQALGGGDRGAPSALRRGRDAPARGRRWRPPSASSQKVKGFSGFGFPKSHAAAFGLLAYQSTWLRVHYGPEFLCALLNEQPMGFYPPDALVHEATATGTRGGRARRQQLRRRSARWTLRGACVIGLGYIRGVRRAEIEALVAERRAERAVREPVGAGVARRALVHRRWICWRGRARATALAGPLRRWNAGADESQVRWASRARMGTRPPMGTPPRSRRAGSRCGSSALPGRSRRTRRRDAAGAAAGASGRRRRYAELSGWETLLADYGTLGMTVTSHPMALLRSRLPAGLMRQPRPGAAATRHRGCGSGGWWWRDSGPGRPAAWCSCCSRTSSASST